jgi:UDP-N-acetylglucosamine 2-epimerase (non-hydrolysing)
VYGDTLSTYLGAVAGRWGGGDIVHLECGLSSDKWNDPFPEEMLRRLIFRKARYAICPNDEAAARMARFPGCIVINLGTEISADDLLPSQETVNALMRWAGKRA